MQIANIRNCGRDFYDVFLIITDSGIDVVNTEIGVLIELINDSESIGGTLLQSSVSCRTSKPEHTTRWCFWPASSKVP